MDQATLVNPDILAGSQVLAALDKAGVEPNVALLMVTPEYGDWRLVLSSPSLDQRDQLKAYEKIAEILQNKFVSAIPQILVLPVKDPFIRQLRKFFGKAKDVFGMRLGGQTIGNRFVENAYVYRIR